MNVIEAAKARRTIRIFEQKPVDTEALMQMIDCARLAPYGANLQPLKFAVITDEAERRKLFPLIKYAGYLEWNPEFEQCPTAFIAILNDTSLKPTDKTECDSGAAGMSICLAATELGLGSVWLGAIDRAGIKAALELDEKYDVTYLVGIGHAAQEGSVYDMEDSIKYYFDDKENVHVPKRSMKEIIVKK
ncbi:MAG: nitroreductase family protein [Candidatus Ornithomonoglobus sp.]